MTRGVLVTLFGSWVLCQLFGGQMVQRLGIAGTADAGITLTGSELVTPGKDARDRRQTAAAPSPAPSYGPSRAS